MMSFFVRKLRFYVYRFLKSILKIKNDFYISMNIYYNIWLVFTLKHLKKMMII